MGGRKDYKGEPAGKIKKRVECLMGKGSKILWGAIVASYER